MLSSHKLPYDYWNHLFNCQERVEITGYVGGNIRHQYQDAYTVMGRGGGGFGFAKLKVVLVSVQFFQAQLRSKLVVKRCLVFHIHINRRRPIVHCCQDAQVGSGADEVEEAAIANEAVAAVEALQ